MRTATDIFGRLGERGTPPAAGRSTRSERVVHAVWATLLSLAMAAAMLLEHIGQPRAAERVELSVRKTLEAGEGLTRDLGGQGNTETITEALIRNL